MDQTIAFLEDDRGSAVAEYALTFALFGIFAVVSMLGFQAQTGRTLVNTRARMVCNSITQRPNIAATVDGSGNITCG